MQKKHLKTLEAVFAKPTRADVAWKDIESLLKALGQKFEKEEDQESESR